MGSGLFWGLLLIVLGFSFIFRIIFNIDFPLFKIFIAFVFIFLGIRLLFGSFGILDFKAGKNDVIFGENTFHQFDDHGDYTTVFGKGNYDFRDFDLENEKKSVKISTVFGGATIKLSREMPVRIKVDAAFAGADLPNGNSAVFGSSYYESPNLDKNKPYLDLRIDVVFGGIDIKLY
ncbi:MAG: cell wall-active antibiotics response protein [Bacteroidales bacterium]|nr:cell wall-active antibiotics response protein [Bacteroidales bacterium]